MDNINEKIDDLVGTTKRINAKKTGPQREIGPSQIKSIKHKDIRTALPSSLKPYADAIVFDEEKLINRRKAMDKDVKPDFSNRSQQIFKQIEYPDQQKELNDLYETGISDKDIAAAKGNKKGGMIKKMAKGGTASSRADGCAVRGKTRA